MDLKRSDIATAHQRTKAAPAPSLSLSMIKMTDYGMVINKLSAHNIIRRELKAILMDSQQHFKAKLGTKVLNLVIKALYNNSAIIVELG
jgi:hypothetical protein